MMWFKKKQPAIYCRYCRDKLVPNARITGYDPVTGKPIQPFLDKLICPNPYAYRDSPHHTRIGWA